MFTCSIKLPCLFVAIVLLLCHHVAGQTNKVSPKLDFDETENKNNSNVPVVPGVVQGRSNNGAGSGGQNVGNSNESGGGSTTKSTSGGSGSGSGGKSGPKIHGVRVTVDTGDTQTAKESKESVEITDVGKHKKRVGIHTDITFEISADGDVDGNATSSAQDAEKEDASVPIYKGRGSTTHKPRKGYDPKNHWTPNFSSEHRSFDSSGRGGPSYAGYYPQYPNNVPVYRGGGDSSGPSYRRGDGWTTYSLWTTERTAYNEPYRPNVVTGYRAPSWKPCYCITSGTDARRRRESSQGSGVLHPTSSVIEVVDGKLERPFSKK